MADYEKFRWGGVTFPLTASTSQSLLRDADPALYWALDFWKSMITTHVGARLLAELATMQGVPIAAAVADTAHFDPGPYLVDHSEFKFPLLAAYRVEDVFRDRTVTWEDTESQWELVYITPALNWVTARRLTPLFRAIGLVVANRTHQGFDPTYQGGALVWGPAYANLEKITVQKARHGVFPDGQGVVYHCLTMTVSVREIVSAAPGDLSPLEGIDTNAQVKDGSTTVDAVVETDTNHPPPDPG